MSAALRTVTSLDLFLELTEHHYKDRLDKKTLLSRTRSSSPGKTAAAQFASLLAAACPNLRRLGARGAVDKEMMQIFGDSLPKLTSLDIMDRASCTKPYQRHHVCQDHLLPHVTHLKASNTICHGDVLQLCKLFHCPLLTHLEVGEGLLQANSERWLLLPPKLKALKCTAASLYTCCNIPEQLQLLQLESIDVSGSCMSNPNVGIEMLSDLLQAAPSLRALSLCACMNTLVIQDSCTTVLKQMQGLHARMEAGFKLTGVTLHCTSDYREEEDDIFASYANFLSIQHILTQMPHLAGFEACELYTLVTGGKAGCFPLLAKVFPKLSMLLLSGTWEDADFVGENGMLPHSIKVFHSFSKQLSATSLVALAATMPGLIMLQHWNVPVVKEQKKLQMRLRATAKALHASHEFDNDAPTKLGLWSLEKLGTHVTKWIRAIVNNPSSTHDADSNMYMRMVLDIPDPWFLDPQCSHAVLWSMGREKISVL